MNKMDTMHTAAPGSLPATLLAAIQELQRSATRLREALMHRRVDTIWAILSEQEQQALKLDQYGRLWQDLARQGLIDQSPAGQTQRQRIGAALVEVRRLLRTNFSLTQCFLAVVRRALQDVGGEAPAPAMVYGRTGKTGNAGASRLICTAG